MYTFNFENKFDTLSENICNLQKIIFIFNIMF